MSFGAALESAGIGLHAGKGAIKRQYRRNIEIGGEVRLSGSADLDTHFRTAEPNANRWDYAMGFHSEDIGHFVIWVEAHSASSPKEVKAVIQKLNWLKGRLETRQFSGLKILTDVTSRGGYGAYIWLNSGKSTFKVRRKQARLLSKHRTSRPRRKLHIGCR